MLMTEPDSYLQHNNFSGFSLNGDESFTIEVRFSYNESNSGSLYSQEDGLDLGIKKGTAYFSHPALGRIEAPGKLVLNKCFCYLLAAVFDKSTLKLFINGFQVSEQSVTPEPTSNSGRFSIGKNFGGYIQGVRVLSAVLTDSELVKDCGDGFQENSACELWTDFTSEKYKDISKNEMDLWQTGNEARCVNTVTCTQLKRNGAYVHDNALDYTEAFSLTGKVYPDFSDKGSFCVCALGSGSTQFFELYFTEQETGEFYPVLEIGSVKLVSDKKVSGLMWNDFAVTADLKEGKAVLYLNGEKVAESAFPAAQWKQTKLVIGTKYFPSKPDSEYSDGFSGYLDYFAQFDKILTADEVNSYAENQPYLYAPSISSLIFFGWGEPEDILSEESLSKFGAGAYTIAAETNDISAPTGLEWDVPDEDEEYWNSLSEYQQWELTFLVSLVTETASGLFGIPVGSPQEAGDIVHRQYRGKIFDDVLKNQYPGSASPIGDSLSEKDRLKLTVKKYKSTNFSVARQVRRASKSLSSLFFGGVIKFVSDNWKYIAAAATIGSAAGAIGIIVSKANEKRPKNPYSKIIVNSACWNENGAPEKGSIHFHNDAKNPTSPPSMEFAAGASIKIEGVFIPNKIEQLNLKLNVSNVGDDSYTGKILLKDKGVTASSSETITLAAGQCITVSLPLSVSQIKTLGIVKVSGLYELYSQKEGSEEFLTRCDYVYYTLPKEPISPWNNKRGEYNPSNSGYVHTELLNFYVSKKKTLNYPPDEEQFINVIIYLLNNCGKFTYDHNGAPHFNVDGCAFKYLKLLLALQNNVPSPLNCADCAVTVGAYAALYGIDCPMTVMNGPLMRRIDCNQIQAITSENPQWRFPFDWNGDIGHGSFAFHMVNRSNENGFTLQTQIYDACLKVDGGAFPGVPENQQPGQKVPRQPQGMQACETYEPKVDVPINQPYNINAYRERLVLNGAEASFSSQAYRVTDLSQDIANLLCSNDAVEDASKPLRENGHITELKLIDKMYGEIEWSFLYDGKETECVYYIPRQSNENSVFASFASQGRIKEILAQFTYPYIEDISSSYPGAECYMITDECYLLGKGDRIFRVIGENAKETVQCLYEAD